ncbi:MAG: arginine--tRNA ligase [Furfurilactobacillus sp.]|jgi:arginyl-tRNA synthetase|uniref:Arginine--tRNA ligase n=1 Tax=Furfurilactobacillus milii TaxID=2888272 RepID=A0ABT6D6S0_9LACO|nr:MULTISPECIES: arginine--tRNA ligase [Furfurilactobacillus]QLE66323.1 Arginyl-tRNA synthetase [Furfurilactobacillus rossiae]MCF6159779.1 arginine--tRNA ligase [Furfurilactobacillus milii]MCF6163136.1 arginine--tRNA ligase [Furfurilactobacillus milii]MCF6419159.1 arginine--tRNA ligase [Furfurilactobacillus milii]MCH4010965.1 arginine--tRNA ligase [Furfurilactobacillus sp.]
MDYKQQIAEALSKPLTDVLSTEQIKKLIETPKTSTMGDLAFPTFTLAKSMHRAPNDIAADVLSKIDQSNFEKVVQAGPYINFFLDKGQYANEVLGTILQQGSHYGDFDEGHGGNVPIDMSSPNIAKPMSMGHLRSTVIGNSIANLLTKRGYHPIKDNHLGDWGTQFGKLITAYKKWGNEADVRKDPITNLVAYYVKFHQEDVEHPELDDEAREWFKKLEDGDEEANRLWKWFSEVSLKEFQKVYDLLGVKFDLYNGEAFYNDKMQEVIDILKEKNLLVESRGAEIVNLDEYKLNPALILKSDGATLYITRDLATAIYREREFNFAQNLYVVGSEQTYYFKQVKAVLLKMGFKSAEHMEHIPFGLITVNGKKLSTRSGRIILLEEVLNDSIALAKKQIESKNPDLKNKDEVARQVGVGAVVFNDLKNERILNIDFNLEDVLKFEGDTGPYVQYTNARAQSLLAKAGVELQQGNYALTDEKAWNTIKLLDEFPNIVKEANDEHEPSVVAKYTLHLAQAFNKYYGNTKILVKDGDLDNRLALVKSVSVVLTEALRLLGVQAPSEM